MKVGRLRKLIIELQPKVQLMFKSAVNIEIPGLLKGLKDEDDLPLEILQERTDSFALLNVYGILLSMADDYGVAGDKKLLRELSDIVAQIGAEFPSLETRCSNPFGEERFLGG